MIRLLFFGGFGVFAISSLVGIGYGLRAAGHRSPDAPHRRLVALNHLNAAWFRDQLSPAGLHYRQHALRCAWIMWVSVAVMLVLGVLGSTK
jgi:hypothetical protein